MATTVAMTIGDDDDNGTDGLDDIDNEEDDIYDGGPAGQDLVPYMHIQAYRRQELLRCRTGLQLEGLCITAINSLLVLIKQ